MSGIPIPRKTVYGYRMTCQEEIRFYAKSALNGFDTLDLATASENAISDLTMIMRTLDRADNAVSVLGLTTVEDGRNQKFHLSDRDG